MSSHTTARSLSGDEQRWSTYRTERTVLAVTHNVTAATRLFDILPLIAEDPRIRIVFTRTGSSAFDYGAEEFLERRGVQLTPWKLALRTEFDMAIAASYGGNLHDLNAPLIVAPHGMGYNKYLNKGTKEQRNKGTKEQRNKGTKEQRNKGTIQYSAYLPIGSFTMAR